MVIVRSAAFEAMLVTGIAATPWGTGFGEDGIELAEARQPELLELQEQLARPRDALRVAAHEALAAVGTFGHESSLLQHGHVLLHGREGHIVARRECGHGRLLAGENPRDDVAARAVGEGAEQPVRIRRGEGERATIWL